MPEKRPQLSSWGRFGVSGVALNLSGVRATLRIARMELHRRSRPVVLPPNWGIDFSGSGWVNHSPAWEVTGKWLGEPWAQPGQILKKIFRDFRSDFWNPGKRKRVPKPENGGTVSRTIRRLPARNIDPHG